MKCVGVKAAVNTCAGVVAISTSLVSPGEVVAV